MEISNTNDKSSYVSSSLEETYSFLKEAVHATKLVNSWDDITIDSYGIKDAQHNVFTFKLSGTNINVYPFVAVINVEYNIKRIVMNLHVANDDFELTTRSTSSNWLHTDLFFLLSKIYQ